MSNLSDFMGAVVKSVQRGTATLDPGDTNISISSVDTSKAVALINGKNGNCNITLTSATNIRINPNDYGTAVSWQVIEFY